MIYMAYMAIASKKFIDGLILQKFIDGLIIRLTLMLAHILSRMLCCLYYYVIIII